MNLVPTKSNSHQQIQHRKTTATNMNNIGLKNPLNSYNFAPSRRAREYDNNRDASIN